MRRPVYGLLILTILVGGLSVAGCSTSGNPSAPSSPSQGSAAAAAVTYGLSGTVTDSGGKPIANARIAVLDPAPHPNAGKSCTTDNDGKYSLSGLTASGLSVSVTAAGYRGAERGLTVGPDAPNLRVEFALAAAAEYAIAGRVVSSGKPVAGATITISDAAPNPNAGKSATSDDAGNYRISGLISASANLSAAATGYVKTSTTVPIIDSDTATANFELTPSVTAYAISGTVRSDSGAPINGATLLITDGSTGPNGGKTATSDAVGAYRISGLTFSTVNSLSASAAGYQTRSRNIPLTFGTEVATADFSLTPGVTTYTIEGTVSSSFGPIAGATVTAVEAARSTTSDSSGHFSISGLSGSSVTISVVASRYTSVTRTVTLNTNAETTTVSLILTQAAPTGPATTITFNGISTGGAAYSGHSEQGFNVAASGASWFGSTYGTPGPAVHFTGTALSNITGQIVVTGDGRPFAFSKVDLYSSVTPIPWHFVGKRNGSVVFDVSGTQPNTFGNFATISNSQSTTLIDRLEISVTNPLGAISCCSNPVGVDSIVVSY